MTPQNKTAPRVGGLARAKDDNQHGYSSILDRLRNLPGKTGSETKFKCCCPVPAHEDRNPSLSVTVADNGTIGLTCFAGCEKTDIVAALDGTMADLFLPKDRPAPKAKRTYSRSQCKFVCAYDYADENGRILYQNVRYLDPDGEKKFWPRRPDGADGWIGNLDGVERVLYRLSEVQRAKASGQTIYFCEGEKDADNVAKLGLCSTSIGSSSNSLTPSQIEILTGCDVVILEDNDRAGIAAAQKWSKSITGSVVVTFRDLPTGGDVSDWIAQGGNVEALQALVEEARANPAEDVKAEILPLTDLSNWRALAREPIDHIFREGLAAGTLGVIAAEGGTGKSFAVLTLSISVALGKPLIDGFTPTRSGRVLCCFAEDDMHVIARRIESICTALSVSPDEIDAAIANERLQVICGRSAALLVANVGGSYTLTEAHAELVERCHEGQYRMIVVDPVIAWAGVASENDNAAMQQAASALIALAKASGGAVLALHHANKQSGRSGDNSQALSRGGSALVDASRWVATMRGLTDADAKDFSIPVTEIVGYVEIKIAKNSYAERSGYRTFLKREEGGALVSVQLENRGADLLTAICEELIENPVNLTRDEAVNRTGPLAESFRESLARRAGFTPKQTEINFAILAGIERKILSDDIVPDGKPGRPRHNLRVLQKSESA